MDCETQVSAEAMVNEDGFIVRTKEKNKTPWLIPAEHKTQWGLSRETPKYRMTSYFGGRGCRGGMVMLEQKKSKKETKQWSLNCSDSLFCQKTVEKLTYASAPLLRQYLHGGMELDPSVEKQIIIMKKAKKKGGN